MNFISVLVEIILFVKSERAPVFKRNKYLVVVYVTACLCRFDVIFSVGRGLKNRHKPYVFAIYLTFSRGERPKNSRHLVTSETLKMLLVGAINGSAFKGVYHLYSHAAFCFNPKAFVGKFIFPVGKMPYGGVFMHIFIVIIHSVDNRHKGVCPLGIFIQMTLRKCRTATSSLP